MERMKNILFMIVMTLTLFSSVTIAYSDTDELMRLLGSRDFWSTYTWGAFDESELFKSATWRLHGSSSFKGIKSTIYSAPVKLLTTGPEAIDMAVNDKTKYVMMLITASNSSSYEDYEKLVSWCNRQFGHAQPEVAIREQGEEKSTTSSWIINNTQIKVSVESTPANETLTYLTTLSFMKYPPNEPVASPPIVGISPKIEPTRVLNPAVRVKIKPRVPPVIVPTAKRSFDHKPRLQKAAESPQVDSTSKSQSAEHAVEKDEMQKTNPPQPVAGKQYLPPPYLWENELGTTLVTNNILEVPENKRPLFELNAPQLRTTEGTDGASH